MHAVVIANFYKEDPSISKTRFVVFIFHLSVKVFNSMLKVISLKLLHIVDKKKILTNVIHIMMGKGCSKGRLCLWQKVDNEFIGEMSCNKIVPETTRNARVIVKSSLSGYATKLFVSAERRAC